MINVKDFLTQSNGLAYSDILSYISRGKFQYFSGRKTEAVFLVMFDPSMNELLAT
jgi:hypothetical protein